MVLINKIDKPTARPQEVIDMLFDLFISLGATDEQCDFPIIYATKDGGKDWQEVKFSYFNFPDEIQYIVDIDSITKENEDAIKWISIFAFTTDTKS